MAMMLMASTNPPVHWFRCRPARLTVVLVLNIVLVAGLVVVGISARW